MFAVKYSKVNVTTLSERKIQKLSMGRLPFKKYTFVPILVPWRYILYLYLNVTH